MGGVSFSAKKFGYTYLEENSLVKIILIMSTSRFEVEKFDGRNDFNLWREKMIAHLGDLGLDEDLNGESKMPDTITNKGEILKKARNTINLSLSDKVLIKVVKE